MRRCACVRRTRGLASEPGPLSVRGFRFLAGSVSKATALGLAETSPVSLANTPYYWIHAWRCPFAERLAYLQGPRTYPTDLSNRHNDIVVHNPPADNIPPSVAPFAMTIFYVQGIPGRSIYEAPRPGSAIPDGSQRPQAVIYAV
ncbi:hypothetical protein C8Q79DRAFT_241094 [Trametes meyenii]|nr:hypothetical protein C8Q79DRAFT_241094 [Trametes meyenii]